MPTEKRSRIISGICTALITALILLFLFVCKLTYAREDSVPRMAEVLLEPEEFVEVLDDYSSVIDGEETPLADNSQPRDNADGVDDGGKSNRDVPQDAPAGNVTQQEPSPVKSPKDDGSDARRKAEEEQRRQKAEADADVAGAFGNTGSGSASSSETASGSNPHGTVTGTGTGKIGVGWGLPGFGNPVSNSTGTIIIEAQIDKDGKVTKAFAIQTTTINGVTYNSKAPAGTDKKAINACIADVKSRVFPRTGVNDGQGTRAYIVYNFK